MFFCFLERLRLFLHFLPFLFVSSVSVLSFYIVLIMFAIYVILCVLGICVHFVFFKFWRSWRLRRFFVFWLFWRLLLSGNSVCASVFRFSKLSFVISFGLKILLRVFVWFEKFWNFAVDCVFGRFDFFPCSWGKRRACERFCSLRCALGSVRFGVKNVKKMNFVPKSFSIFLKNCHMKTLPPISSKN